MSRETVQFAVQSIVWGKDVEDIAQMLSEIYRAGYRGVELFQDIEEEAYGGPQGLHGAFRDSKLTLVGVASGSLTERMRFVKEYCRLLGVPTTDPRAPYVYVDGWDRHCIEALRDGLRIGLHPHMFRPVQTMQEAAAILREFNFNDFPNLQLLPDTAHLTIAGDDPVEIVKNHVSRMAAIHMKDWSPIVGRSYQFYASGFCGLGDGSVNLRAVLDVLWKRRFNGWIVIEHDYSATPLDSVDRSMKWLRTVLPPTMFF